MLAAIHSSGKSDWPGHQKLEKYQLHSKLISAGRPRAEGLQPGQGCMPVTCVDTAWLVVISEGNEGPLKCQSSERMPRALQGQAPL